MEKNIIDFLNKHKFLYVPIPKKLLENIGNLLFNNKKFEPVTSIDMLCTGVYWKIKNDFNDDVNAMMNLACYYERMFQTDEAIKYYLMAIEYGSEFAHRKITSYHLNIQMNEMKLEVDEILKKSIFVCHENFINKEKKLFQLDNNIMNSIMKDITAQYGAKEEIVLDIFNKHKTMEGVSNDTTYELLLILIYWDVLLWMMMWSKISVNK